MFSSGFCGLFHMVKSRNAGHPQEFGAIERQSLSLPEKR